MGKKDYLEDYLDGYFDEIDSFEAFHNRRGKGGMDQESTARKEARKIKEQEVTRARKRKEHDGKSD